jgi:hypothetical protein
LIDARVEGRDTLGVHGVPSLNDRLKRHNTGMGLVRPIVRLLVVS